MKEFIKQRLVKLLTEAKKLDYEYQIRDIGGTNVYYKRKKGEKIWCFIDEKEFNKKSNKENTIKYKQKYK